MTDRILEISDLVTTFNTPRGEFNAVDGISFYINKGETLAVVGESGCGKSVTALSILRLVASPPGRIASGRIMFEGNNLLDYDDEQIRRIRGAEISMIFQEPMTSLNPVFSCGDQISEVLRLHEGLTRKQAEEKAIEMLRSVGIALPEQRVHEYPHSFSGGMRQRVMIAMALACNPKLLIADEPTTALDVTIQAQILELMKKIKDGFGTAILLITHDLGVVAEVAQRVVVMYAGKVVEEADVDALFYEPSHPYTKGLLSSVPKPSGERKRLDVIEGIVPNPANMPTGCRFHPRCKDCMAICLEREPPLAATADGRRVACWLFPASEAAG